MIDGTAVLGLGDIGPAAGMPVMEGKCVLFKRFGNVDAFPLCVRSKDVDTIVDTVALLAGSFVCPPHAVRDRTMAPVRRQDKNFFFNFFIPPFYYLKS